MFYSMLYLSVYLNTVIPAIVHLSPQKTQRRFDPMVIYAMNVLMMGLAVFIALTRISDYHHHPMDVLSGTIIGSITGLLATKFILMHQYRSVLVDAK